MKEWLKPDYRERIVEEAAEWYARLQEPQVRSEEREAFSQWLCASAEHVREYLQLAALHAGLEGIAASGSVEELIWEAGEHGNVLPLAPVRVQGTETIRRTRGRSPHPVWAVAAALGLLALGAWWLRPDANTATYTTSRGEQKSIALPDGSVVTLNALSQLRLSFAPDRRDVRLATGEAFFEVAKDTQRPFRVRVDDTLVQAIGTRFNVYHRHTDTTVTVVDGVVEVRPAESESTTRKPVPVRLTRNQQAHVELKAGVAGGLIVSAADAQAKTAWRERRLVFESRTLGAVAQEFNLYNETQLVVMDPKLKEVRVSGAFNANDPNSFAQFLQEAGIAQFMKKGDGSLEIVVQGTAP